MLHERLQKGDTLVIEDTSDNPVPAQVRTVHSVKLLPDGEATIYDTQGDAWPVPAPHYLTYHQAPACFTPDPTICEDNR